MRRCADGGVERVMAVGLVVAGVAVGAASARAADIGTPESGPSVQVHGFVSQGWMKSTGVNYLAATKRAQGSFELTEVGINFSTQPTERLRIGMQLFARDLGPVGNYNAKMDWLMLDYRWRDWFGIRAGRVKLPFGLYNDISDIDAARVPVLLPPSVYSPTNRDFFLAQSGFEVYGYIPLGRGGALDYRVYGGTIYVDRPVTPGASTQVTSVENPYLVGGRVLWETPLDGLRVGGSFQPLRLDINAVNTAVLNPAGQPTSGGYGLKAELWLASLEYAANDWLIAAEYGRNRVTTSTSDVMAFPPIPGPSTVITESGYLMLARRIRNWLQPGVYHSVAFSNVDHRTDTRQGMSLNTALTLRFDINANWLIKVEGHHVHGTQGLSGAMNNNTPPSALAKDWLVVLVKTTAYF
jgi:hypothetical protein